MPTDHPDGTFPVALIMADIMMPVDIQAQYVTLNVDITAQTLSQLNINIAAQTLSQLNINIAASAVTLTVSVTGTANIDIIAQSVGVYLQPEWAALQGVSKYLRAGVSQATPGNGALIDYTVPSGKTLYINCFSGSACAFLGPEGDLNQMVEAWMEIDDQFMVHIGGNGGFSVSFPTPVVVNAEQRLEAYILNFAAHDLTLNESIVGYEI